MNAAHARKALAAAQRHGADTVVLLLKPGGIPAWRVRRADVTLDANGLTIFELAHTEGAGINERQIPTKQTWIAHDDVLTMSFWEG